MLLSFSLLLLSSYIKICDGGSLPSTTGLWTKKLSWWNPSTTRRAAEILGVVPFVPMYRIKDSPVHTIPGTGNLDGSPLRSIDLHTQLQYDVDLAFISSY